MSGLVLSGQYLFVLLLVSFSIGQCIFAFVSLLFSSHGDKVANRWLASLLVSVSFVLSLVLIADLQLIEIPHIKFSHIPLMYVLPILLWLYVEKATREKNTSKPMYKTYCLFFIPLLVLILLIPFYSLTAYEKMEWHVSHGVPNLVIEETFGQRWASAIFPILRWFFLVYLAACFILCYRRLNVHKKNIENAFSYKEKINLSWLRYLVSLCFITMVGLTCWELAAIFIPDFDTYCTCNYNISRTVWLYYVPIASILISVFGHFGVNQINIYNTEAGIESKFSEKKVETDVPKYLSSKISNQEVQSIADSLREYVTNEKVYLTPDLNINTLAEMTGNSARDISRAINEKENVNFFTYINNYRIDEAKERIARDPSPNILEIAFEVGFNSKSAFYEAFKRQTGLTPIQYKRQCQYETA